MFLCIFDSFFNLFILIVLFEIAPFKYFQRLFQIDEHNNKKRTLTEVLFGSSKKENQPPLALPMNYKELETQLLKERLTNKQLYEEIYKLKAEMTLSDNKDKMNKIERHKSEILSPKSKIAMQQIVNSPSKQKSDFYRQNSVQRMHHNIPHR